MTKNLKRLTIALWVLCLLVSVTVVLAYYQSREMLAAAGAVGGEPRVVSAVAPDLSTRLFPVPAFALRNENDQPVNETSLQGRPWIAAFIFTNCAGTCPMMSKHMAVLQEKITNPEVRLVSFTLDPARDTPAVLKGYAAKLGAQAGRWSFLTGTPEQMQAVARGMMIGMEAPLPGSDQITHSNKFLLVDKSNTVRGIYEGTDENTLDGLAADAEKLARE